MLLRHVTTRDAIYSQCEKVETWVHKTWRHVSRTSDSTAGHARYDKCDRRDSHDTCSGASPQRGLQKMDMSTSFFPQVFRDIYTSPEHKRLHLYTHALLPLRRPQCLNKDSATRTTITTRQNTLRHDTARQSINQSIIFSLRLKFDRRGDLLSLPHVGITQTGKKLELKHKIRWTYTPRKRSTAIRSVRQKETKD